MTSTTTSRSEMSDRRTTEPRHRWVEWLAAALGIFGALWLASGWGDPLYGWVAFFLSNLAWIAFARCHGHGGLGFQHVACMASSVIGILRTLDK